MLPEDTYLGIYSNCRRQLQPSCPTTPASPLAGCCSLARHWIGSRRAGVGFAKPVTAPGTPTLAAVRSDPADSPVARPGSDPCSWSAWALAIVAGHSGTRLQRPQTVGVGVLAWEAA